VVRSRNKIQIAVQVRSKLSNPDDLSSFTIAVSIPGRVDGTTVKVLSGDGQYDRWKRVITWEVQHLPKGQSFMVSAKCMLQDETSMKIKKTMNYVNDFLNGDDTTGSGSGFATGASAADSSNISSSGGLGGFRRKSSHNNYNDNTGLKFPVLLRCKAQDKVSTARFQAIEATGHPATVTSSLVGQSFRMIHRLH
jgi:hypothetical protein